ncbi:MAG: CDP-glycerol glycerophosphotransferase family protein [Candidatus Margulisiibacteriota bacterium]|nr:CDP-glycerol glycerophosphotransferase family protein [Candidatus Margulisiibacteriota bacterium]
MKNKILIYLSGEEIYKKYVQTKAFAALEGEYDVYYLLENNSRNDKILGLLQGKTITYDPKLSRFKDKIRKYLVKLFVARAAKHSSTYARGYFAPDGRPRKKYYLYRLLFNDYIYRVLVYLAEKMIPLDKELKEKLKPLGLKYMIIPIATPGNIGIDLIKICRELGILSVVIPTGWDNASSKLFLYLPPDVILERGTQNKDICEKIFGLKRERIFRIGVPHYEMYYEFQKKTDREKKRKEYLGRLGIPADKVVILLGGSLRPFDETSFLIMLDDLIARGLLKDAHVIYRPHPERDARIKEKSFFDCKFENVTFDGEMRGAYLNHKSGYIPDLRNFLDLYNAIDFIISPFSSVMVEAGLFGNLILGLACSDGVHAGPNSVQEMSKREHFTYLKKFPWFVECKEKDRFLEEINKVLKISQEKGIRQKIKDSLAHIVYHDERSYSRRILESLKTLERKGA